jgi:hypothetical protein
MIGTREGRMRFLEFFTANIAIRIPGGRTRNPVTNFLPKLAHATLNRAFIQVRTIRDSLRPPAFTIPERVENRQSHEVPLIGGDDDAVVGAGN